MADNSALPLIIAPSLLACDHGAFTSEIKNIEQAGAEWLHIDVMDGSFVPPITFGDNIVAVAKKNSSLFLDVHLMIMNPEKHFESFKKVGADRVIIHQEACPALRNVTEAAQKCGLNVGVSVKPNTAIETVFDVLDSCDLVLVMTVEPGWGGQPFIESMLPKVEKVREQIVKNKLNVHVEVDGGINPQTAARCVRAGANVLVAGSSVFGKKDRQQAIAALKNV